MNAEQINKTDRIESEIIAHILARPASAIEYSALIKTHQFYSKEKAVWYETLQRLIQEKGNYDAFKLLDKLSKDNRIKSNFAELETALDLFYGMKSFASIDEKSKVLLECWMQRKLYNQAQNQLKALAAGKDVFDIIDSNKKDTESILSEIEMQEQTVASKEDDFIEKLLKGLSIVPSAFSEVNETAPYVQNEMHVIGARPGAGKTARILADALHAAKEGFKVAIFTAEMSETQLIRRFVYYLTGVSTQKMRLGLFVSNSKERARVTELLGTFKSKKKTQAFLEIVNIKKKAKDGQMTIDDFECVIACFQELKKLPIFIKYETNFNRIKSTAIAWNQRYGIDIIFIDYLSLLSINGRFQNEEQRISTISRETKKLAGQNQANCCVVMLSQLSRKCEERSDKKPVASDLRYSGGIEQDADVITLLFRAAMYFEDVLFTFPDYISETMGEMIVTKNREGSIKTIFVEFQKGRWVTDASTDSSYPDDADAIASARPKSDDDIPF